MFISIHLNCTFQTNSSQFVCSLFLVYYRFTPWTKSWLNLNSSSSRPSASRCSHKRNEKNACQGKHSLVRVTLQCYYSYFCIIVNHMIITSLSLSFKPKCIRWRMHGCISAQTQYLNLSVQSYRKHWVICTKPKISSYLSENHPVKRHSLTLYYRMLMPSVPFHFHSLIVNCNFLYDMQCLLSWTSITLCMIVQSYFYFWQFVTYWLKENKIQLSLF